MKNNSKTVSRLKPLDKFDEAILAELQKEGRIAVAELSERIGLSVTPCWRRVRRLEESGIIRGYTALIDFAALGLSLDVFVEVDLDLRESNKFEEVINGRREVIECYAVTGDCDYQLHVIVADMSACDRFLREDLVHFPGVKGVKTRLALKSIKQ